MNTSCAQVQIQNVMGIHLRPASALVQICNRYPDCEVEISKDDQAVNGKSIMGVIMLAAEQGCEVEITVTGEDGESLLAELVKLIEDKFNEE